MQDLPHGNQLDDRLREGEPVIEVIRPVWPVSSAVSA